jgi:hypothetical protein
MVLKKNLSTPGPAKELGRPASRSVTVTRAPLSRQFLKVTGMAPAGHSLSGTVHHDLPLAVSATLRLELASAYYKTPTVRIRELSCEGLNRFKLVARGFRLLLDSGLRVAT